jgi:hypothetical protein
MLTIPVLTNVLLDIITLILLTEPVKSVNLHVNGVLMLPVVTNV